MSRNYKAFLEPGGYRRVLYDWHYALKIMQAFGREEKEIKLSM